MDLKGKKINFLGDSITEGYYVEHNYVNLVGEITGAECRNYGLRGTRIARQQVPYERSEFDADFCQRVEDMATDADIVVVYGGVNDYIHGDAPFGGFGDKTPDSFCGALYYLYARILQMCPDAVIVAATPLHKLGEDERNASNGRPLSDYAEAVRETARYFGFPVLDLWSRSGLQPNIPVVRERFFNIDGLHPNAAGHAHLAKRFAAFLKTL